MIRLFKSPSLAVAGLIVCLLIAGCTKTHVRQAILAGDVGAIEAVLKAHSEQVNQRDADGDTMLHVAVQKGDEQIVRILLQYGAEVDAKNAQGETPIEVAAFQGSAPIMRTLLGKGAKIADPGMLLRRASWAGHVEVADLLIKRGADINAGAKSDSGKGTPLHAAVTANRPDMVEFLITNGADVNAVDNIGHTPLHHAAESLYTQIAKTLLAHGAKVDAASKTGDTPLHRAAGFGRVKMVETLLSSGANVNAKRTDGQTPLDMAAMAREVETVNTLRKLGGKPSDRWELFDAVMLEEVKTIDRILTARPSAATELADGYTVLHLAARRGRINSARALLANKVDVGIRGSAKQTPLHVAAQRADTEMARLLLDHGAQINARDKDGKTPLAYLYKFRSPIRPPGGGRVPLNEKFKPAEEFLIARGAKE